MNDVTLNINCVMLSNNTLENFEVAILPNLIHNIMENKKIENCIDACETCADACETCSTENKGKAGMETSEKLCIACADACNALVAASKTDSNLDVLFKKCEDACNACATECEKHSDMKHCKECADACRKCAAECKAMLAVAA